jgi:hypothetical protein
MTRWLFILLVLCIWNPLFSAELNSNKKNPHQTKASTCTPPTSFVELDYNAVKARINTNGVLWTDRENNSGEYRIGTPAAGMSNSPGLFYAGSIWIGGKDNNGQLKLAAMLYGARGNDFWPGPLSVSLITAEVNLNEPITNSSDQTRPFGEATVTAQTCVAYDRFFTITRIQVQEFKRWWECSQNPNSCITGVPSINPGTLNAILNWPAHGDEALGQDKYLAPFYDRNKNGLYDPLEGGDYPWYDLEEEIDCKTDRRTILRGDITHWWVFNDKGNIHGETGGTPIGVEIRAQAFAFKTANEINSATFYNYEIINRSTSTLYDTYFAQFADPDIGGSEDDYVGCDVSRGISYAMNGDNYDATLGNQIGWGERPPAVGINFIEGPYQDDDGKDNIGIFYNSSSPWVSPTAVMEARVDKGIVYKGLGTGYGDGIIDNERMGMRYFYYYNRAGTGGGIHPNPSPILAHEFYNNMTGFHKNGQRLNYGGYGTPESFANPNVFADYYFPGNSDPLGWGVHGAGPQSPWNEFTLNNPPGDRRFVQSVGPFTLKPGGVNNLTVGVIYGRGEDYIDSRSKMLYAHKKAQALFDNCFRIVEPPHAPRLQIRELENELILTIDNPGGNNQFENFAVEDNTFIVDHELGWSSQPYDKFYRFEGYQVFQVKHEEVTVEDLYNSDLSRLAFQCDIENGISRIINYNMDDDLGVLIPQLMVDGANKGILHSFNLTEDLFALGTNKNLVNHKTYYYIAIAYAHNEYKPYNPNGPYKDGQTEPYISSKRSWDESQIRCVSATPHHPMPTMEGTLFFSEYGTQPEIRRLDGRGNMGLATDLHQETINEILQNNISIAPKYAMNRGPVEVKVIDPLTVLPGHYELKFHSYASNPSSIDTASWTVYRYDKFEGEFLDSINSDQSIGVIISGKRIPTNNEQLIPEWGISIRISQYFYPIPANNLPIAINSVTDVIESSIHFADSSMNWLTGVKDTDFPEPSNWILSGMMQNDENPCFTDKSIDIEKRFNNILNGTITHFRLLRNCGPGAPIGGNQDLDINLAQNNSSIGSAPSVNLVFTKDKSLWTRAVVVELCQDSSISQGNAQTAKPRARASVDKNGRSQGQAEYNAEEGNLVSATGMGWFPGYAIDVETGRRLNIAFGENSFLAGDNGADMLWNPTSRLLDNVGNPVFGGQHVIYIIGEPLTGNHVNNWSNVLYDNCASFYQAISSNISLENRNAWRNVSWVMYPMLAPNKELLATETTIKLRVKKRFENFWITGRNEGKPAFDWNMDQLATQTNSAEALHDALKMINVVPNPYYAYSAYSRNHTEQIVKITNLPVRCQISIYNLQGNLIRAFDKNNPISSVDWDLKNHQGLPIAGGVYLIHVHVPEVGERVLKWFGGLRQIDF